MNRKPESIKKGLFADGMWGRIFTEGAMIGLLTLLAFSIGNNYYGLETGRAMAFMALSMLELIHSFNIKSDESIFKMKKYKNPYLIGAFALGMVLQICTVSIPGLAKLFQCGTLDFNAWLITIIISLCPIAIMEIQKKVNELRFGKRVYGYRRIRNQI